MLPCKVSPVVAVGITPDRERESCERGPVLRNREEIRWDWSELSDPHQPRYCLGDYTTLPDGVAQRLSPGLSEMLTISGNTHN